MGSALGLTALSDSNQLTGPGRLSGTRALSGQAVIRSSQLVIRNG